MDKISHNSANPEEALNVLLKLINVKIVDNSNNLIVNWRPRHLPSMEI